MSGRADEARIRAELLEKYEALLALRVADDRGPAVAAKIRDVSGRFPGALRELDRTAHEVLVQRLALLAGPGPLPDWAAITHEFHRWTGAALRVRRAAGRDRDLGQARVAFDAEPAFVGLGTEAAGQILGPPGGRLSQWVLLGLAARHDLSLAEVTHRVFGHLAPRP